MTNPFRHLPSVNDILDLPAVQSLRARHAQELVVDVIREELAETRQLLSQAAVVDGDLLLPERLAQRVEQRLTRNVCPKLRPVINATGIVLHTNLGRAPVAEEAARAAYDA